MSKGVNGCPCHTQCHKTFLRSNQEDAQMDHLITTRRLQWIAWNKLSSNANIAEIISETMPVYMEISFNPAGNSHVHCKLFLEMRTRPISGNSFPRLLGRNQLVFPHATLLAMLVLSTEHPPT